MHRYKNEEKRKNDKARKGLSQDEIMALDLEDETNQRIEDLARTIHAEKFPEEYDFMYDSGVDAKDSKNGVDPMSQEYIDKIERKRNEMEVTQSAENGVPVSDDSFRLSFVEAQEKIYSDINLKRPPAETCVFCNKNIKEIGGRRLVAQKFRGLGLYKEKRGGGNKDYPHKSLEIFSDPLVYMVFWGEKQKWTEAAIISAQNAYLNGKRPWFCQVCGSRQCRECGSPINYPVGSDILYGDGCTSHAPIFPFDPGCINTDCMKYKKWDDDDKTDNKANAAEEKSRVDD